MPPEEESPVEIPLSDILDLHTFAPREVGELVPHYLDSCAAAGLTQIRIVHGKGTGALRERVHKLLARHPVVDSYRLAGEDAGGWGATLVTLKRSAG